MVNGGKREARYGAGTAEGDGHHGGEYQRQTVGHIFVRGTSQSWSVTWETHFIQFN